MIHIILAAAAVSGCLVLFLVIVNLAATPRLSRAATPAGPTPRVSVIVPARNEERAIAAGVGSQLAQDYPDFEVLVVNDRSTDRTGTILANVDRPRWLAAGGGAGNMIRRGAYEAIGGHEALKASVVDDVALALRVKRSGFRARAVRAEDRVAVRMYRGFREVWDGFGKNVAYLFQGFTGGVLLLLTVFWFAVNVVPPALLLFALLGAEVSRLDLDLAACGAALPILARVVLAAALGDPLWPSFTPPIMAAVWAGITCRSLFQRVVLRRLTWRGREFDARGARF